jgi:hypothetical protein
MVTYICYDAGCDIYEVEKFDPLIDWHKNEFKGTFNECIKEKENREHEAYRFNNFLPHLSNCE